MNVCNLVLKANDDNDLHAVAGSDRRLRSSIFRQFPVAFPKSNERREHQDAQGERQDLPPHRTSFRIRGSIA
jgi:hypothetical protein